MAAPYLHTIRTRAPPGAGTLVAVGGPLICVIEDEQAIADAVAGRLRAEGVAVEVAPHGPAALPRPPPRPDRWSASTKTSRRSPTPWRGGCGPKGSRWRSPTTGRPGSRCA